MENKIFVNQIGYDVDGKKFAFIDKDAFCENEFSICSLEDSKPLYTAKISPSKNDELTCQNISSLDFSDFTTPGTYKVCIGEKSSFPFKIGKGLYEELYFSTLDYFYLSRCGQDINRTKWAHPACHTGVAEIYGTNLTKEVKGGWHDAGDYGRYIVAASKTVMDLLLAYEYSNKTFNSFDILDECRFELEWMLQLQREDGAVFHKISCYNFCAFIMPHLEKEKIVLAPVSTTATADFAGCLAYASSFYKDSDEKFSKTLLDAAIKAQNYLDTHEDTFYTNPSEITTGGYGDSNVSDEKYFALCSLFAATKNKEYFTKAKQLWNSQWHESFSWGMVSAYGTEILLKKKDLVDDKEFITTLEKGIVSRADEIVNIVKKSPFQVPFTKIFWGSNGFVCDEAHIMLLANKITNKEDYIECSRAQLNYLLGCNPLNICYVTGFGQKTVNAPHHRPSGAVNETMPGMLSGGPSQGLQDAVAREHLQGKAPISCFIDHVGSYSTNEVAIYWNSPFVLLIAALGLV